MNKSAEAAGTTGIDGAAYRLVVTGGDREVSLSLEDLRGMEQVTADLPIACVEGWSASGTWTGVRIRDLAALVGGGADSEVVVRSLQESGPFRTTVLPVLLRRRRPHPAGARAPRRDARARPRLPDPGDRAEPARRAADQVGRPARGAHVSAARAVLGLLGVGIGLWGAWLLVGPDGARGEDLVSTALWLGSGVVLHDFALVPLVLVVGLVAGRLLPPPWRAAAAGGLVVLGSVTLLAVPVLGRFGARENNPTLLDRPYGWGWAAIAALVLVGTVAVGLARRRRHSADA